MTVHMYYGCVRGHYICDGMYRYTTNIMFARIVSTICMYNRIK